MSTNLMLQALCEQSGKEHEWNLSTELKHNSLYKYQDLMKDILITLSNLWLELFFTSLTKEPTKCN